MRKIKIIDALLQRGLFEDKKTAESWILAGKIYLGTIRIDKPGTFIENDSEITIKNVYKLKYVNKGGLKLEGALSDFRINLSDKIVIDAGASTGGFTDCALHHGAKMVYAVDAGYDQLAWKLRSNLRVVNLEKVNISNSILLKLDPKPNFATIDLSYLSLKKAIPVFSNILHNQGEAICLVKPIFEVDDSKIRRNGFINDPDRFNTILSDLSNFIKSNNYSVLGITNSCVTGNKGTIEFLIYFSFDSMNSGALNSYEIKNNIISSIEKSMSLSKFKK